ncbi:hypothetical protein KIPE111705_23325 [Kibdelosporangium persicum]
MRGIIQPQPSIDTSVDDHGDEDEQDDQERRRYGNFRRHGSPVCPPPGYPSTPAAVLG